MISSFKEVVKSLKGIQDFSEQRGCFDGAMDIASTIDSMANLRIIISKKTVYPPDP